MFRDPVDVIWELEGVCATAVLTHCQAFSFRRVLSHARRFTPEIDASFCVWKLAQAAHGERGVVGKLRELVTLRTDLDTFETGLTVECYTQAFRDDKKEECRKWTALSYAAMYLEPAAIVTVCVNAAPGGVVRIVH